jgi:hypothetical protein
MKKSLLLMTVIGFTSASFFVGCDFPTGNVENSRENIVEAQLQVVDAKRTLKIEQERFRRETEVQLSENRNQLTELKSIAASKKIDLRITYNEKIAELERKNSALEFRLKRFESEENTEWQNFRKEFDSDMDALVLAFKDLTRNNVN